MNLPQDDLICECFHCNGKDFKTSKWMTYGTINLIKCKQCDLIHLYPIAHQTSGYEDLAQEETVRQIGLLNEKDATSYNHANGILDLIETHTGKREGRLLDIGCKFGDLLIAADRRGWNTIGIELNEDFCAIARDRGLEVYNDVIERFDIDISGFDIIILSHVLEHIERPDLSLKAIFDRLNPMGILYVETPNQSSPIAWGVYRGRWLGVATPGHIWAFTQQTLKKVVQSTGFEIIWQNRWIPYSTNDYPKTIKGQIRRYLFSFFNWLGQGDMVGIIAQKP